MEPIIHPVIFYFIGVSDSLRVWIGVISGFFACAGVTFFCIALSIRDYRKKETEDYGRKLRSGINSFVVCFSLFLFSVLIPTRDTLIKMIIFQNITSNNIKMAIKFGTDMKDVIKKDIMDIIAEIEKGEKK